MECLAELLKNEEIKIKNVSSADILPLPATRDGIYITNSKIKLKNFFDNINKNTIILCGNKNSIPEDLNIKNKIYDYSDNEIFLLKNAELTAQGTIKILLNNCDKPFNKTKILVSGFGRIGKNLVKLLIGLEFNVYILGNSDKDSFWINKIGTKNLNDFKKSTIHFDYIINTVPKNIFSSEMLQKIGKINNFIELASQPGIDLNLCQKLGINHKLALGIPGKIFPKYAAEIIKESILNIINNRF